MRSTSELLSSQMSGCSLAWILRKNLCLCFFVNRFLFISLACLFTLSRPLVVQFHRMCFAYFHWIHLPISFAISIFFFSFCSWTNNTSYRSRVVFPTSTHTKTDLNLTYGLRSNNIENERISRLLAMQYEKNFSFSPNNISSSSCDYVHERKIKQEKEQWRKKNEEKKNGNI